MEFSRPLTDTEYQQQQQQQQQQQHHHLVDVRQDEMYTHLVTNGDLSFKLINQHITSDKFVQDEVLLIHTISAVGCKNYGLTSDIVDKYKYAEVAGFRYTDPDIRSISCERDRGEEGSCIINKPPMYEKGPTVATLVSQYGIGKPLEENKIANKVLKTCHQESFTNRLRRDTLDQRVRNFNKCLFSLANKLKSTEYKYISKIILPIGIGRGMVDERWLMEYFPILLQFIDDMSFEGKQCYFAVRKSYLLAVENNVNKNCTYKSVNRFRMLKSVSWIEVDDKWFSDILVNKEKEILENTSSQKSSFDVPDTQYSYM